MSVPTAGVNRRHFLSSAVLMGALGTLMVAADPNPKALHAATARRSLLTTYGTNVTLRNTTTGAGILKTYKDAFSSTSVNKASCFIGSDNRVKIAFSVIGLTNQFQVVDALTGKSEFSAAVDSTTPGSISMVKWNGKTPDVYTASMGNLSRFTHYNKTLTPLGKITPTAGSGYGPAFDAQGRAWIGLYPSGGVACYDPATGVKKEYPKVDPQSEYVRSIVIMDGIVYCGTGSVSPKIIAFPVSDPSLKTVIPIPDAAATGFVSELAGYSGQLIAFYENTNRTNQTSVYNTKTKQWTPFKYNNPHYRITINFENDGCAYFVAKTYPEARDSIVKWDPVTNVYTTLAPAPMRPMAWHMRRETGGIFAYMFGGDAVTGKYQMMRVALSSGVATHNIPVDVRRSAYKVQDILASTDGKIYVGGYMGEGLQTINIATDVRWKSKAGNPVKQVEGMMEYGTGKIYVGSYGSAELISYTKSPESYKHIIKLRDKYMQSRPYAWAKAAGMVVNGTVPEYGLRGGALTVINPATDTVVRVLNKFIPEQSIVGLVGSGDIVYGTTSVKGGYGIADDTSPAKVFAYNVRTNQKLWVNSSLINETEINSPIIVGKRLFVGVANGVIEIDMLTGKALRTFALFARNNTPGYRNIRLGYVAKTNRLIHSGGGTITAINLSYSSRTLLYQGTPGTMSVRSDGRIFAVTASGQDVSEISVPATVS